MFSTIKFYPPFKISSFMYMHRLFCSLFWPKIHFYHFYYIHCSLYISIKYCIFTSAYISITPYFPFSIFYTSNSRIHICTLYIDISIDQDIPYVYSCVNNFFIFIVFIQLWNCYFLFIYYVFCIIYYIFLTYFVTFILLIY
jgi:hypothetical protein